MVNFFFFSFQEELTIEYMKITVKFDNQGEGNARFSFKMWLKKENLEEIPKLYLLISNKNRRNNVTLKEIDEDYNKYLTNEHFREAAGIEDTEDLESHERCTTGKIVKFEENRNLKDKNILNPRIIHVKKIDRKKISDIPKSVITNKDILLEITPLVDENIKRIAGSLGHLYIMEFQFRIFLRNFLHKETLESWESSSESWSVNIDIHKDRGFDDICHFFRDTPKYFFKYPENIDLPKLTPDFMTML